MAEPDGSLGQLNFYAVTDVPVFLGYVFSYGLQGILVSQVFIYHISFPKDSKWVKWLVWISFLMEMFLTVSATSAAVGRLAVFGDLDVPSDWAFKSTGPLVGLITLMVHAFFCRRIWIFGEMTVLPILIILVSLAQCITASISGVTVGFVSTSVAALNIVWLGGSAVCDISIATTLLVLLCRAKNSTMFRSTKSILSRLMLLTIETGMITAIASTAELVLYHFFPDTCIHFVFLFLLPKLYANCMMASLNSRLLFPNDSRPLQTLNTVSVVQPRQSVTVINPPEKPEEVV